MTHIFLKLQVSDGKVDGEMYQDRAGCCRGDDTKTGAHAFVSLWTSATTMYIFKHWGVFFSVRNTDSLGGREGSNLTRSSTELPRISRIAV